MKYTDPSGYFWKKLKRFVKKYWKPIVAIGLAVVTGGAAAMAFLGSGMAAGMAIAGATGAQILAVSAAVGGTVGGFVSGAILTGSLQGALTGAAYGALSGGIAGYIGGTLSGMGQSLAHGVSQGAITEARGGTFRAGFWSGLAASAVPVGRIASGNSAGAVFARTSAAAVVGGTASRLGGGKFANGAVTGAFVHLFNAEAHTTESSEETQTLANKVAGKLLSGVSKLKDFMGLGRNPVTTPSVLKGAAGKGFGSAAAAGISVLNVDAASTVTDIMLRTTIIENYSDPLVQRELMNMMRSDRQALIQRLRQDVVLRREGG